MTRSSSSVHAASESITASGSGSARVRVRPRGTATAHMFAARAALTRRRGFEETTLSPRMREGIRRVFGAHAEQLSVSSTKSMHGHALGASGALEMIACVKAIEDELVPPTINHREADPACDLDITPNVARKRPVRAAISNAFAFGGTNVTVAVRRHEAA
jgi:hypothetical protein